MGDVQPDLGPVSMAGYLHSTLEDLDRLAADLAERRAAIALKLAVIEAAEDPAVVSAETEFEEHSSEDRHYDDAAPAEELLGVAFKRFVR